MQDNEIIYRIEFDKEEYELLQNLIKEVSDKLSKMSNEEISEYLRTLNPEQNLNFELKFKLGI